MLIQRSASGVGVHEVLGRWETGLGWTDRALPAISLHKRGDALATLDPSLQWAAGLRIPFTGRLLYLNRRAR